MGELEGARTALAAGRWDDVEAALADAPATVEALELLAEARWWRTDVAGAIAAWTEAHALASTVRPTDHHAAVLAAWIAREFAAIGNTAAATGWLARADHDGPTAVAAGWRALAAAHVAAHDAGDGTDRAKALAEDALGAGRRYGDRDLELLALARVGLAEVRRGDFGAGLARFDEAMALATAGAATRLRTVGELCCDLVLAVELTGDVQRFARWMAVVQDFVDRRGYPSVLGFCATCCAEADALAGEVASAEQRLRAAVVGLHETGHAARCVPPTAKLGELLVLQGRLEEADDLVGDDDSAEGLLARAHLALARNDVALAVTLAQRCARRLGGDTLVKIAALGLLVDAHVEAGDEDAARGALERLESLTAATASARAAARAAVARGRLARSTGHRDEAVAAFEAALDAVAGVHGSIEGADAHLELARLHLDAAPAVAGAEARAALAAYEAVGATRGADAAAALLRSLGHRGRVGPKGTGVLSRREGEVLRLVAQGLTNAEIADRLFISVKTAGNHVSSILTKLNLRSRAEAAAYAALHPERV